jgi:hypothetical protein
MGGYWEGRHEEAVFHVANSDGQPLRGRADMDGVQVLGEPGGWYVKAPAGPGRIPVRTVAGERSPTVKTECPRAVNRRRKCALCAGGRHA